MDSQRFDEWTRAVTAEPASRRRLLRGVAGSALGAMLVRLGGEEAAAACHKVGKKCDKHSECCDKFCKDGECACRKNRKNCGGRCSNLRNDPRHCGGCGLRCASGITIPKVCLQGRCCRPDGATYANICNPAGTCAACCSSFCNANLTCAAPA